VIINSFTCFSFFSFQLFFYGRKKVSSSARRSPVVSVPTVVHIGSSTRLGLAQLTIRYIKIIEFFNVSHFSPPFFLSFIIHVCVCVCVFLAEINFNVLVSFFFCVCVFFLSSFCFNLINVIFMLSLSRSLETLILIFIASLLRILEYRKSPRTGAASVTNIAS
jgi:hypothetical protein